MADQTKNGAQALIQCLENAGVEYIFGYPGGAVIPIFDALLDSKIELILVRHEQGAVHMADGYARATGKVGAVIVTSGPGATNAVTGLFTANMDSVPLVVISGQVPLFGLGKDAFQEADTFGITAATVKHNYLIKDSNDIPRVVKEAFYIASTGRPGPVLIDIPKDVSSSICEASVNEAEMDLPGYTIPGEGDPADIRKMAQLFRGSKRPLILAGHGVLISGAHEELRQFSDKIGAPVANTILGKGAYPETAEKALGFVGMHGMACANKAIGRCDLIISIGSRWDDRITPANMQNYCPNAIKLHIDIDPAEFNKVVTPDATVCGDAKLVLRKLTGEVDLLDTKEWLDEIAGFKKKYKLTYKVHGGLKAQHVIDEMYKLTDGKAVVCVDVGQHQMWAAQFYKTSAPKNWICSGGAGTMGFGFPAALGAQFGRPDDTVVAIVGDGGFQMTLFELSTAMLNNLNVKIIIIDNKYLGMVRQWQELFFDNRTNGVDLKGSPDFVKLAESYGVKGMRIKRAADVTKVLQAALDYKGPVLIHAEVLKEGNVFPMIPAGGTVDDMLLEAPKTKLAKPMGST